MAELDRQVHARGAQRFEAQVSIPRIHVLFFLKTLDLVSTGEYYLGGVTPKARAQLGEVR